METAGWINGKLACRFRRDSFRFETDFQAEMLLPDENHAIYAAQQLERKWSDMEQERFLETLAKAQQAEPL